MSIQPAWSYGSGGSGEVADSSITTAKLADPAGMPTVRRAAGFGAGVVLVTWAVENPSSFTFAFSIRRRANNSGVVMGRAESLCPGVQMLGDGTLRLRNGTVTLHTTPVVAPMGVNTGVEVRWSTTGADVYVNGALLESVTFASPVAWLTGAKTHFIGAQSEGVSTLPADIWDVRFGNASAANSAFFALDGDFENTAAGSSVADATPSGFISWPTVLSTGGSERAVLAGGPVRYSAARTATAQALDGSVRPDHALTYTADVDPTGSLSTSSGIFAAPAPGVIEVLGFTTLYDSSTNDVVFLELRVGSSTVTQTLGNAPNVVGDRSQLFVAGFAAVDTGDITFLRMNAVDVGNTGLKCINSYFQVLFHPTA